MVKTGIQKLARAAYIWINVETESTQIIHVKYKKYEKERLTQAENSSGTSI